MSEEEYIERYNRMKSIEHLLSQGYTTGLIRIKEDIIKKCNHIWLCIDKKDEIIEEKDETNIIGMHYTVKCPICGCTQVYYFPIQTKPTIETTIIYKSYEMFVSLLEGEIEKANKYLNNSIQLFYLNEEYGILNEYIKKISEVLKPIGYYADPKFYIIKEIEQ